MRYTRCVKRSGFSLIELTIAIALMVVAILALQAALVSHQVMGRINQETNIALNEVRAQMETVKSQPFQSLSDGVTTFDVTHGEHTLNRINAQDPVGTVTVETEVADTVKRVTVAVAWRSANGKERTVRLATFISEH